MGWNVQKTSVDGRDASSLTNHLLTRVGFFFTLFFFLIFSRIAVTGKTFVIRTHDEIIILGTKNCGLEEHSFLFQNWHTQQRRKNKSPRRTKKNFSRNRTIRQNKRNQAKKENNQTIKKQSNKSNNKKKKTNRRKKTKNKSKLKFEAAKISKNKSYMCFFHFPIFKINHKKISISTTT